jgi:hypothetical protein
VYSEDMKKIIIGMLLLIPFITNASFERSLKFGMSGQDVSNLQEFLITENCLSHEPTGYFGYLTLAGVKCFQSKYDIINTGFFGQLSRAKANEITDILIASSTEQSVEEATSTVATTPVEIPIVQEPTQPITNNNEPVIMQPTITVSSPETQLDGAYSINISVDGSFVTGIARINGERAEGGLVDFGIMFNDSESPKFENLSHGSYTYTVKLYSAKYVSPLPGSKDNGLNDTNKIAEISGSIII